MSESALIGMAIVALLMVVVGAIFLMKRKGSVKFVVGPTEASMSSGDETAVPVDKIVQNAGRNATAQKVGQGPTSIDQTAKGDASAVITRTP